MHTTPYISGQTPSSKRLIKIAGVFFMVLGVGHLIVVTVVRRDVMGAWVADGIFSVVPLGATGAPAEMLQSAVAFWAGPASFAVPLFLLGYLFWHLAGIGVRIPRVVGWVLVGWLIVSSVILSPSPFYLGIAAAVLVVIAGREKVATRAGR